jgi:hypothetical protein
VTKRVNDLLVAQAVTVPGLGQQVGRLGHALHAAGHKDGPHAGAEGVRGLHDALEPRAADLVHGDGAGGLREAGVDGGLPRRGLALAGLEDVAHEHIGDAGGGDAGPRQGSLDGHGTKP